VNDQADRHAAMAAAHIRQVWPMRPWAGVILGTGMHELSAAIEPAAKLPYGSIPQFPHATALSHHGQLICGHLARVPVVVMDGRCHRYEGYRPAEITLPVFTMRALGAELLIATNASGGLNPRFASGDVMAIEDHLDLMFGGAAVQVGPVRQGTPSRMPLGKLYDSTLVDHALSAARRANFAAHRGVYAAMSGPNYETRAEYRMLRRMGVDAVGMSTVPEVLAARECGMRVLALSIITNIARPDCLIKVDASEVVAAAARAERHVRQVILDVLASMGDPQSSNSLAERTTGDA
jgi:purine-nucleoside phosphorylase